MKLPIFLFAILPSAAWAQLGLPEAVARARAGNPMVGVARAELVAAEEQARMARAMTGPSLTANGFAATSEAGTILGVPGVTMGGATMGLPAGETAVGNLMLMLPLWTGGTLQARLASATAGVRAAAGMLAEAEADAGLMAEEAYLMAQLAGLELQAQEARRTSAEEMLRTTQARLDAGKEIEASVRRAEAELAAIDRVIAAMRAEEQKALLELQEAMGDPLGEPVILATPTDNLDLPRPLEAYLGLGLENRGLIVQAQAELEVARQNARAASGALGPQVYGQAMADASTDEMMNGTTFALTVSIPLFDGGQRRAEQRQMRAMVAAAEADLQAARLRVQKEVRQAYVDVLTAGQQVASAEAGLRAAESAYETMRVRVEAGKGILLEQLDALQMLAMARVDLARARSDRQLALARLHRAAGTQSPGAQQP